MKSYAKSLSVAILSVFLIFGGMLLSACGKQVSLSVSTNEVTISTNNPNAENYGQAEIGVTLTDSSEGVRVEVIDGQDSIHVSSVTHRTGDEYYFTIYGDSSGEARVRVSSIEDFSASQEVAVSVDTYLEEIVVSSDDTVDNRSNLFAVKGDTNGTKLDAETYFDFRPVTANIRDVDWNFDETGTKELTVDDLTIAYIENNILFVSENCDLSQVVLRATFVYDTSVSNVITFEVLENAAVSDLSISTNLNGEIVLIEGGVVNEDVLTNGASFEVKRNDASRSNADGTLVVNSDYDVNLSLVVLQQNSNNVWAEMAEADWSQFFQFNITQKIVDDVAGTVSYNFSIDAQDQNGVRRGGDFKFFLRIGYVDFNYDISTQNLNTTISSSYAVERVELSNVSGNNLNNNTIDVFSDYTSGFGYTIRTLLTPTDVTVDNNLFYISVDINQSALAGRVVGGVSSFVRFFYRGTELQFEQSEIGSTIYVSTTRLQSGSEVQVRASENISGVMEGVEFEFVPVSDPSKSTSIYMNLLRNSTGENLIVTDAEDGEILTQYISSSQTAVARSLNYRVKVRGISSLSGLELQNDGNQRFIFSNLTLVDSYTALTGAEDSYVIFDFTVSLVGYNFEAVSNFWFEHVTGSVSQTFQIYAFVPLTSASITNGSLQSTNVFESENSVQGYVYEAGEIVEDTNLSNESLSKLTVEAGATISLNMTYQSLSEEGVTFRYLSFDNFVTQIRGLEGLSLEEATTLANQLFRSGDGADYAVLNFFNNFTDVDVSMFNIYENRLIVSNNDFRGFVVAVFSGFDMNHESVVLLRAFALESLHSVTNFTSTVGETLLYTVETLSQSDIARSYVDVSISFRNDDIIPTYTGDLSYLTFTSEQGYALSLDETGLRLSNGYYSISNMQFMNQGRMFTFRITADSTRLATVIEDTLRVTYQDPNGFSRSLEIGITIRNVNRVENVTWVNETYDGEIYLNLTSQSQSERRATISTSISPANANDRSLTWVYTGASTNLNISTNETAQTFNLSINTEVGGVGYLYLLPSDMVKNVDGINQVLLYSYSTDVDGDIVEEVKYVPLDQLEENYQDIVGEGELNDDDGEFSNYFLNNDGEKVYNANIILRIKVTIADGLTEETAIRIYNESELRRIDTARYYTIMNNITLNSWQSFETFSGMLFGNDDNITLTMAGESQVFVDQNSGTIRDLTFAGNVSDVAGNTSSGFLARVNNGTIQNVVVDVYYATNERYSSSTLSTNATTYIGGIAGENYGNIINSFTYGMTINSSSSLSGTEQYVGGIAGFNSGSIQGSGVEFYNFVTGTGSDGEDIVSPNTVTTSNSGIFGGIVGYASESSQISSSYAYAYPMEDVADAGFSTVIRNTSVVGAFMGVYEIGASVNQSFAFMGNLQNASSTIGNNSINSQGDVTVVDSYVSYYYNGQINSYIWFTTSTGSVNSATFNVSSAFDALLPSIWVTENIDADVNFGLPYLQSITQNVAVDVSTLSISRVEDSVLKALDVSSEKGEQKGILFLYAVSSETANGLNSAEQSDLQRFNTISLSQLFGLETERQANTLLLTTPSSSVLLESGSIRTLSTNLSEFEVTVHSRMDFTQSRTFEFVVLNNIPTLVTTVDGQTLSDGQTVMVQKDSTVSVSLSMDNTIYLNSNPYQSVRGAYSYDFALGENVANGSISLSDANIRATLNGNTLSLTGISSHSNDSETSVQASIVTSNLDEVFSDAIKAEQNRDFVAVVFDGATALEVSGGNNLSFKTSEYAEFDVTLISDNAQDNLVFGLIYDGTTLQGVADSSATSTSFEVDDKLQLDVTWGLVSQNGREYRFHVVARVNSAHRHLVDKKYDIQLTVNALSQRNNTNLLKTVDLTVNTQNVESIFIQTYSISGRSVNGSTTYYRPSSTTLNTLSPASDAIVTVSINPAYALMTHFTLTYQNSGSGSGVISISKLERSANYGFYASSSSTSSVINGLQVDLTDEDKTGDGVFYFRVYVYSSFTANSQVTLTANFYNGDELLDWGSIDLNVDYLSAATVRVNGQSTYLLAKGESATVTVTTELDQNLDSLTLQNTSAGYGVSLTAYTYEDVGNQRIYTAYVTADVDARLANGASNGIFQINATVSRTLSGYVDPEIKVSTATIYLVDFTLDADNISLNSSGSTSTYNGRTYDVFYSYIGATDPLSFTYPLMPETYNYDPSDPSQVSAVETLLSEREEFLTDFNYANETVGYYINYGLNETTGRYSVPLTLKQQLSYATAEGDGSSSPIYNENYDHINQNDLFRIEEDENRNVLEITGTRTGRQLMKLTTTVIYQNTVFTYDYYFLIVVDIWSDEETPTQITTAEEFVDYATNSEQPDDYILMNDITLSDYTPLDTDLISSLDGNGYTIHINSFAMPTGNTLNLALFNNVVEGTTLKNVRVNIYAGGQIDINIAQYSDINIAGFAIRNDGTIYNCEVVSYRSEAQTTNFSTNGIVVNYTIGENTTPVNLTDRLISYYGLSSNIAGFVITNTSSIVNSRVGGSSFRHVILVGEDPYLQTETLGTFTIQGQDNVAGFAISNSGNISSSFAKSLQINNNTESTLSTTAGFVITNTDSIQASYVEGVQTSASDATEAEIQFTASNITTMGVVGGFVYENIGEIKNAYSNIAIENETSRPSYAAGFVYINSGNISLCFSASQVLSTDSNQKPFSGVDSSLTSLNTGSITNSYYYNGGTDVSNQTALTPGVIELSATFVNSPADSLYGFSFTSGETSTDGIWTTTGRGITLVSANQIAISNRYAVTNNSLTSIFYRTSLPDVSTLQYVNITYGGENNPIIIRDAYDFVMATGDALGDGGISYYRQHYTDTEISGHYRLVNDVDMSEIDQNNEEEGSANLTTFNKTFSGVLDGNGFTISNINLGARDTVDSYGLFKKLDGAIVMNLNLIVDSIHNAQASVVGTLAGVANDSVIVAISITPSSTNDEGTSILGNNIVGGVVGMLFGQSKMYDVTATNIVVYSSSYSGSKIVGANDAAISRLRNLVDTESDLRDTVSTLSYAGAIVGFVDVYSSQAGSDFVEYSNTFEISDYDIVKIHVTDAVDIYGEVAGGLFGYVGNSTYVYDANLELDASDSGDNPSYIIAKNLYAGGLVGENYGGLFAVYASYSDEIQELIEENENAYYNGNADVEKGQQDIFSHKVNDTDAPLYVGGLVGYMGGGFISTGYSKLNVIVDTQETKAIGGIVGMVGVSSVSYDLTLAYGQPEINILLNEVYASGDLHSTAVEDGAPVVVSGGLIGAIGRIGGVSPVIALKNALAMNYYSFSGASLLGDETTRDATSTSSHHYALVGSIFNETGVSVSSNLNSGLYLIASSNEYFDVATNNLLSASGFIVGTNTVGGYSSIVFGQNMVNLNLFGFDSQGGSNANQYVLNATSIGSSALASMSAAYNQFNSYFIENGWSDEFWTHSQDDLFPHIQLVPQNNIWFWDVYNTPQTIQKMRENPNLTVIVRGKVEDSEYNNEYTDINLTDFSVVSETFAGISNFSGTLISYSSYMNDRSEGVVNVRDNVGEGGELGEDVGLIVNRSLFNSLADGAVVEGLSIYMSGKTSSDGTTNPVNYSLVAGDVSRATFTNLNLVYNNNISLTAGTVTIQGSDERILSTGLIASVAYSTTIVGTIITLRESSFTFTFGLDDSSSYNAYLGVLAGYIEQNNDFNSVSIQGLQFEFMNLDEEEQPVVIDFNVSHIGGDSSLYAGLYAGAIVRSNRGRLNVGITDTTDVILNIVESDTDKTILNAYIGGFVGELNGVTEVTVISQGGDIDYETGITIHQNVSVGTLYAGLGFGQVVLGGGLSVNPSDMSQIIGAIYQGADATISNANVGGLIGHAETAVTITGLSVNLTVAKLDDDSAIENYDEIFAQNAYDYNLSPFTVSGCSGEDSFGGLIGNATDSTIDIRGTIEISGAIDVATNTPEDFTTPGQTFIVSVGGAIGRAFGCIKTNMSGEIAINIAVQDVSSASGTSAFSSYAYVGGFLGFLAGVRSSTDEPVAYPVNIQESSYVSYTGTVLADVNNLKFGGTIGYVGRSDYEDSDQYVHISNYIFGGAVKIFGSKFDGGTASVGGIVGEFNSEGLSDGSFDPQNSQFQIYNSSSYGDVFVNYLPQTTNVTTTYHNYELQDYNFGGIVGKATYMTIQNCNSIMTSFNNRVNAGDSGSTHSALEYNVNAIVGESADAVNFVDNKYSSVVCMAYQEQSGNTDLAYGTTLPYQGYTNLTSLESIGSEDEIASFEDILDVLESSGVTISSDFTEGHKLNPYIWENYDDERFIEYHPATSTNVDDYNVIKSSSLTRTLDETHNISWVAFSQDADGGVAFDLSQTISTQLVNVALIGNGQTLNLSDSREVKGGTSDSYIGGLVDEMGVEYGTSINQTTRPNFNVISGFLIDANILVDIDIEKATYSYGAVTGLMTGNSFIYGVGVKGEVSVGSSNSSSTSGTYLELAGIAGSMQGGFINQSYVDADIVYRGNSSGHVAGVANVNTRSTIMATYSSGKILSYTNVEIFTFASFVGSSTFSSNVYSYLIDDFSIAQFERTNIISESITEPDKATYFIGVPNADGTMSMPNYFVGKNIMNGTAGAEGVGGNYATTDADSISLPYSSDESFSVKSLDPNAEVDTYDTEWFFSPFINYGYASHGFGYLKNVTTYTRDVVLDGTSDDDPVPNYEYTPITYWDILSSGGSKSLYTGASNEETGVDVSGVADNLKWFYGVPNEGKFIQMLETISVVEETSDTSGSAYTKAYRFLLRYDIDMENVIVMMDENIENVGKDGYDFILDGNGRTLDFAFTENSYVLGTGRSYETQIGTPLEKSLFNEVIGSIENLRLSDINVKGARATFANNVVGNLSNITVIGNLSTSESEIVGGVVAEFQGTATAIQANVNVDSTLTENLIVGGVFGKISPVVKIEDDGTETVVSRTSVSYSSNSGNLIAPNVYTGDVSNLISFFAIKVNSPDTKERKFDSIVGGVVGYSDDSSIDNSYNAGAVLSGYTINKSGNFLAGGIVGYAVSTDISSSFNTGLVGAGSYVNADFSYAGGIFGYAVAGEKDVNVTGCINDGQVEALNRLTKEDNYEIEIFDTPMFEGGDESSYSENTDFTKNPSTLYYYVTITYNPGELRHVYAYGIGTVGTEVEAGSASLKPNLAPSNRIFVEDCSSSDDNIINDGNVGEVSDTKLMKFDRKTMLNNGDFNGNGSEDYEAKFSIEKNDDGSVKYTVNGYDSYGIPARIYVNDTMTRKLAEDWLKTWAEEVGWDDTFVRDAEKGTFDNFVSWFRRYVDYDYHYYSMIKNLEDGTIDESAVFDDENGTTGVQKTENGEGNFITQINESDEEYVYYLQSDTTYYSSVSFVEYDQVLKGVDTGDERDLMTLIDGFGLLAFDCNIEDTFLRGNLQKQEGSSISVYSGFGSTTIESEIEDIDNAIFDDSSEIERFYVDGDYVAVARNRNNILSVVSPYIAHFKADIEVSSIDADSLSKDNVTIEVDGDNKPQFKVIDTFYIEDNIVHIEGDLYFVEPYIDGKITVGLAYQSEVGTFTLRKENVDEFAGYYYIYLDLLGVDETFFTGVSNDYRDETVLDIQFQLDGIPVELGDYDIIDDELYNTKGRMYLKLPVTVFSSEISEGNILTIIRKVDTKLNTSIDLEITTESSEYNFTINSEEEYNQQDISFVGFDEGVIGEFGVFEDDTLTDIIEGGENVGVEIPLSVIIEKLENSNKFAFGDMDGFYAINYSSQRTEPWSVTDNSPDDGVLVSISGDALRLEGDSTLVNEFVEEMSSWTVYYNTTPWRMSDLSSDMLENEQEIKEDVFLVLTARSMNEQFSVIEEGGIPVYIGSPENFDSLSGEGIVNESVTYFGMDFHAVTVTYICDQIRNLVIELPEEDVGYDIRVYEGDKESGTIKNLTQGVSNETKQVSISGNIAFDDSVYVSYVQNTQLSFTYGGENYIYGDNYNGKLNIYTTSNSLSISNSSDLTTEGSISYSVEKGNDEDNGSYISTSREVYTNDYDVESYEYRIYDNGMIEISYLYSRLVDGGGFIDFDLYEFQIDAEGNVTSSSHSFIDGLSIAVSELPEPDVDESFSCTDLTEFIDGYIIIDEHHDEHHPIDIDLIVGDFDENGIQFIKNETSGLTFGAEAQLSGEDGESDDIRDLTLYVNTKDESESWIFRGADNYVEDSLEIRNATRNGEWQTFSKGVSLNANSYTAIDYEYRYKLSISTGTTVSTETEVTHDDEVSAIVLNSDISLGEISGFDLNEMIFNGNGFMLKYISKVTSDGGSLFEENSGDIRNLNFVAQTTYSKSSFGAYNSGSSILFGTNSASLLNVKTFGNFRNISAQPDEYSSVLGKINDGDVVIDVDSSVTMDGADASSGQDVNITLAQYEIDAVTVENINYVSHEVFVAGNAVKGDNGEDGTSSEISSASDFNGGHGDDGGHGGQLDGTVVYYSRSGLDSIGGYGGNGAHGTMSENKAIAYGGGGGGQAGENGAYDLHYAGNRVYTESHAGRDYYIQYGGNGGVGCLGYVTMDEYLLAGAPGGSGNADRPGSRGSMGRKELNIDSAGTLLMLANNAESLKTAAHLFDCHEKGSILGIGTGHGGVWSDLITNNETWGTWKDSWKVLVEDVTDEQINDETRSAGDGADWGKLSTVKELYVRLGIEWRFDGIYKFVVQEGRWDVRDFEKYVWTSGEAVNSGGIYGVACQGSTTIFRD